MLKQDARAARRCTAVLLFSIDDSIVLVRLEEDVDDDVEDGANTPAPS